MHFRGPDGAVALLLTRRRKTHSRPKTGLRSANDLLNRISTIQITPKGWVQSEMNDKVTKEGKVVPTEVGWIEYRRTADDSPCDEAKKLYPSE
jgi:hypothetical protein